MEELILRTVIDDTIEQERIYEFNKNDFMHLKEVPSEQRSCFYDFGATQSVTFKGYSSEHSSYVETLRKQFINH